MMNSKRIILAGLLAILMLAAVTAAVSAARRSQASPEDAKLLAQIRRSTANYQQLAAAESDGYGALLHCLSDPQAGAMGFHYVNGDLVGDDLLDPLQPEALVYEQGKNGQMKLVALEYIVFVDVWDPDGTGKTPPQMLGQTFEYKDSLVEHGVPPFYELHVWLWKNNPSGIYADYNPKVSCP